MSIIGETIFSPFWIHFWEFTALKRSDSFTDSMTGSVLNLLKMSNFPALPLAPIAFFNSLGLKTNSLSCWLFRTSSMSLIFNMPVDCEISTSAFPFDP